MARGLRPFIRFRLGPPVKQALVVTIPGAGGTTSAPTGQVFNGGPAFGGAVFLFDSEDGVISSWNGSGTTAVVQKDFGSAAVYKGLAISDPGTSDAVLYATNFRAGTIEAYDHNFDHLLGSFTDPNLPRGTPRSMTRSSTASSMLLTPSRTRTNTTTKPELETDLSIYSISMAH